MILLDTDHLTILRYVEHPRCAALAMGGIRVRPGREAAFHRRPRRGEHRRRRGVIEENTGSQCGGILSLPKGRAALYRNRFRDAPVSRPIFMSNRSERLCPK